MRVLEKAGEMFDYEPAVELDLKGLGEVQVQSVTRAKDPDVKLRGSFARLTPLVRRADELQTAIAQVNRWLETRYAPETWDITKSQEPLAGRNRLMIIRGVPAVGKSRPAYEIGEKL